MQNTKPNIFNPLLSNPSQSQESKVRRTKPEISKALLLRRNSQQISNPLLSNPSQSQESLVRRTKPEISKALLFNSSCRQESKPQRNSQQILNPLLRLNSSPRKEAKAHRTKLTYRMKIFPLSLECRSLPTRITLSFSSITLLS